MIRASVIRKHGIWIRSDLYEIKTERLLATVHPRVFNQDPSQRFFATVKILDSGELFNKDSTMDELRFFVGELLGVRA